MQRTFELSTHVQAIGRNDGTSRRQGWAKRRDGGRLRHQSPGVARPQRQRIGRAASSTVTGKAAPTTTHTRPDSKPLKSSCQPMHLHGRGTGRSCGTPPSCGSATGKRGANANSFKANAQTARDLMFHIPLWN